MGQRLNIEIHANGKLLANSYLHWSAYTDSALYLTKQLVNKTEYLCHLPEDFTDKEKAVWLLQGIAGGLCYDGSEKLVRPIFLEAWSRNDGLICLSEEEMEGTRNWEEGRVTIDIERKEIDFDVWFSNEYEGNAHKVYDNPHVLTFENFGVFYDKTFNQNFVIPFSNRYLHPIR